MVDYKISFNSRWNVEYDYDTKRDCERHGGEDVCRICRCGRIVNPHVTFVNVNPGLFSIEVPVTTKHTPPKIRYKPYKPTIIEQYCLDRLLRIHRVYDVSLYNVHIVPGYYGEEVGDITFNDERVLVTDVERLLGLQTDIDKIKFVLKQEYTYVLESLVGATAVAVEHLHPRDLLKNDEYALRLKRAPSSYHMCKGLPVGVVHNKRLIDGYHRFSVLDPTKKYPFVVVS